MKNILTGIMVGALLLAIAVPIADASQWDPKCPPPNVQITPDRPAGDDGGWVDPTDEDQNNPNEYPLFDKYTYLNFIVIEIITIIDIQVEDNHAAAQQPAVNR